MDRNWLAAQFALYPEKKKIDLAKKLNLPPPAISKILAGGREIKAKEYALMRHFFGLPTDGKNATMLSKNAYVIKPFHAENTHGSMQDSARDTHNPKEDWVIPAHLLREKTTATPDQIRIFRIEEDAMSPDFKIGEYVLVDLSSTKSSPSGVFLVFDGVGEIIRHCEYTKSLNTIRVSATKKGYSSMLLKLEDSPIIGRVLAKIQWIS